MNEEFIPQALHPGVVVKTQMELRGWNQLDLANIMGVSNRLVNELIGGKRSVTPQTAQALEDAFEILAEEWMKLQALYDLAKSRLPVDNIRQRKSVLWNYAPVREMTQRGWLVETENIEFLEAQVKQFFRGNSLDSPKAMNVFARKSTNYEEELSKEQLAWFQRCSNLANGTPMFNRFSHKTMPKLREELAQLLPDAEKIRHVPRVMANYGVRFFIVEHLRGSKIDGVCFWLDKNAPVIALTMRYNRIDWFWFTLAHELAHVHYLDGLDNKSTIDTSLVGTDAQSTADKPEEEKRADNFATSFLVNEIEMKDFLIRNPSIHSDKVIRGFAKRINTHPGIVVGQLQHMGKIPYSYGRELLINVRDAITPYALTDGWGKSIPI